MNSTVAHLLTRLYPRAWRDRYGAEFETHLQTGPGDLRASANVVWSALRERVFPTPGLAVNQYPSSVIALAKQPSALLPLAMSLTALAVVLGHVAIFGVVHEADEGTAAHIWQLLIAGHVPVVAFFAIKWLPRATRQTLLVLAMLAGVLLANFAAVFFLT
jgi:hypothetical protein